jgi:hypothetical protein
MKIQNEFLIITKQVGDLVMLENNRANKYEQLYSGPYHITQVNMNGTVHLKINAVTDTVNIQCIHPFKTPNSNLGGECSMRRFRDRRARVN